MNRTEDLGFSVMASYEAKLTMVEGVFLGAGAAIAFAASHFASASRAEVYSMSRVRDLAKKFSKNESFMRALKANDDELRMVPFSKWTQDDYRKRLEGAAMFALQTDASLEEVQGLIERGGGRLIQETPIVHFDKTNLLALKRLAKLPKGYTTAILKNIIDDYEYWKSTHPYHGEVMSEEALNVVPKGFLYLASVSPEVAEEVVEEMKRRGGDHHLSNLYGMAKVYKNKEQFEKNFDKEQSERLLRSLSEHRIDWEDPRTVPALKKISAERSDYDIAWLSPYIRDTDDLVQILKLGGLKIPHSGFSIEPLYEHVGGKEIINWDQYRQDLIDFSKIPVKKYEAAMIPQRNVLAVWRKAEENEDVRKAIFLSAAIVDSDVSDKLVLNCVANKWVEYAGSMDPKSQHWDHKQTFEACTTYFDNLSKALKSGMLKKFDQTCSSQGAFWYRSRLKEFLMHLDEIKDWKTFGELAEQLDVFIGMHGSSERTENITPRVRAERRARDRLAQRDPEWAIAQYPEEYRRGKRIAKLLEELVDHVESIVKKGDTVVVHGRDGELLYDLLMRRPGIDRSKVKYAITSRPVTTFAETIPRTPAHRKELERYYDYLARNVPTGAVHVDTGFEGSIPRWLDQQGFEVKAITMVSANRPEEEIPVKLPISAAERRDIVLSDLEHSSQRLDVLKKYDPYAETGGFGNMVYSYAAPGYHARAYGVYDELGLPRLRTKTPRTRFEEQRFRIAEEPAEGGIALEEEATFKVK